MIVKKISRWLKYYINNKKILSARKTLIKSLDMNPVPPLPKNLLKNTKVYKDRLSMLKNHIPKNSVCAEIGIAEGVFSENILSYTKPKSLHLIELSSTFVKYCEEKFKKNIDDGIVSMHQGFSYDVISEFPANYFDWAYIDGDHSYDTVKKDLIAIKDKIKPNGLIMFDDYVNYSHYEMIQYGVVRAVNEFCNEYNFTVEGLTISEDTVSKNDYFGNETVFTEYTNIIIKKP